MSTTSKRWLGESSEKLKRAGISTARLDAIVLLEDAIGKDRAWLLAHSEFELSDTRLEKLEKQIERRAQHEPLAYIRGKTEFYSRQFYIDYRVLQPRSESETMIDLLKSLNNTVRKGRTLAQKVVDVGTGSGALGVTAKLEIPELEVIATDIDKNCLDVARKNAKKLGAEVTFLHADLLQHPKVQNPASKIYGLLANLPYVPNSHTINQAAMHEPGLAIFGGPDGLDVYRRLFAQLKNVSSKPWFILTESLPPQHGRLAEIAASSGFHLQKTDDFIQVFTEH